MSNKASCPNCHFPLPDPPSDPLRAMAAEIERIREIAEQRVEELGAQVRHLQETIARLRAHSHADYR